MNDSPSEAHVRNFETADDYEVVRLSIGWGGLSLLAFTVILVLQMFGDRILDLRLTEIVLSTLALAITGFVLGLVGMKFGRGRRTARLGAFLNGVVLFCVFVLLPVAFQILRRLG